MVQFYNYPLTKSIIIPTLQMWKLRLKSGLTCPRIHNQGVVELGCGLWLQLQCSNLPEFLKERGPLLFQGPVRLSETLSRINPTPF